MFIVSGVKDSIIKIGSFLNQPVIKEGVKNVAGAATFVFGFVEIYDIYQSLKNRNIQPETSTQPFSWSETVKKIVIVCAKISLILSGMVSRPGVFVISILVGRVFTPVQLESVFGPNTIFAINPWHPRHVASITAVILALPAVLQGLYQGASWAYRKVVQAAKEVQAEELSSTSQHGPQNWLTDMKIRLFVVFNTTTSRPVLHIGNQLVRML